MKMKKKRVLLNVKRFKQHPCECGIAAVAALSNFYDSSVVYRDVRKLCSKKKRERGLMTYEQAELLNKLGFGKVSIVTGDLDYFDLTWINLDKYELLEKLEKVKLYYRKKMYYKRSYKEDYDYMKGWIKWLNVDGCDNNLIIDQDFPKYIRRYLDHGRPVLGSFNWTALHKFKKSSSYSSKNEDITGYADEHAVVIRGYDDFGIFVVDSHYQYYKGRHKKYQNGYYKISWAKFLVNAAWGDLILVG